VRSVLVVIFEISSKDSKQMVLTKDNDVIGTLTLNTAVQSRDVRVLPRTAIGRQ